MLRIGVGKPRIIEADDRWNVPTGRFYVPDFCWVGLEQWQKLEAFEAAFDGFVTELYRALQEGTVGTGASPLDDPYLRDVFEKKLYLNPEKMTLWQFNGLHRDGKNWVRHVAVFAHPTLVRWSWWDAQVLWRALRLKAWGLNSTARLRQYVSAFWQPC